MSKGHRTNRRMCCARKDGFSELRVWRRAAKGTKGARILVKCGCCQQKVEVYHSEDDLEINGVLGSLDNWREILLPLLYPKSKISVH